MAARSTYRLQLTPDFGFDAVAGIARYLRALGVTHVYLSPHLQATAGSMHGYDVVDHSRVSDELGGPEGHARMLAALREHGLGVLLDIVPNHMAITTPENRWWWDVLENGPSSRFAAHFDVEWRGADARMHDKVLMPILGDHYGRVLEAKQIRVERDEHRFCVRVYDDHTLPMAPRSLSSLLYRAAARLAAADHVRFIADALHDLPAPGAAAAELVLRRQRDKEVLYGLLATVLGSSAEVAQAVDEAIAEVNGEPDALDEVLEAQNYRLSHWRLARHDLDYRRFFDINTLVGLCVERPAVFEDTHRLLLQWVRDGHVDGLRVDHPDGLRDPARYLQQLRERASGAFIVVEKILSPGERLPDDWPVDGTTGYDFLDVVTGLYVDSDAERAFTELYDELTGEPHPTFDELVQQKKALVLDELFSSELGRLTAQLADLCEQRPRHRDYGRSELRLALRSLLSSFSVYRTYAREAEPIGQRDRAVIEEAVAAARTQAPELDERLFALLRDILLGRADGPDERDFVARLQQLSGPAMAKGQEDTAFYCFHRLCSLNEVGCEPGRFGRSIGEFHDHCRAVAANHPGTLLASSTHDTKRSEDTRCRISALSEIPDRWAQAARTFRARVEAHRVDGLPDLETTYLLHQTLVGAFPIERERLEGYMLKAVREAKLHTSWLRPDQEYEQALSGFIERVLSDRELCEEVARLVEEIEPGARMASLSQLTLKLTAPGTPDIYQGTEVWRHDLTDPDNRRDVDFAALRDKLSRLDALDGAAALAHDDAALLKLFTTRRLLALRAEQPGALGTAGGYAPLSVTGEHRRHIIGFSRGDRVFVVAPRLFLRLGCDLTRLGDTTVGLPSGSFKDVFVDQVVTGGDRRVSELLARFPVAVLVRD